MRTLRARDVWGQILPITCFLAVSGLIAFYRFMEVSDSKSFGWDSASFLENGAVYAGFPQYKQAYDPTRPPVIPVLLSIAFRITGPSAFDGYVLSGILYFVAMLGAYLLAKEIMNPWLAILPAVSYGLAPMVIEWGGINYSNVEGTSIAALGLAAFVYAMKYRSGFYLLALPLLLLAPLTRYTLGVILFVAIVYAAAYKANGGTLTPSSPLAFSLGLGVAIVAVAAFGSFWLGYPLSHGFTLSSLFPTAGKVNPFTSSLGHFFWAINLPNELGTGAYMYIITIVLILSSAYVLFSPLFRSKAPMLEVSASQSIPVITPSITRSFPMRSNVAVPSQRTWTTNPLVYALLFWFLSLFLFYSIAWSYYDPRYSVEFIMPALIIAFWGIDRMFLGIYRRVSGRDSNVAKVGSSNIPKVIAILLVIILVGAAFSFLVVQSGAYVVQNTPVVDTNLNGGMRQAASWVDANVPSSARIEGDWYTFLWWYLPNYTILEAPAAYQLQSSQDYATWLNSIYANNVSYVIYSNGQAINVPPQFQPVFTSNESGVTVFRVTG